MTPPAPHIPWARIAAVHFSAALVVMVALFAILGGGSSLELLWVGIIPLILGGALPPYLGGASVWWLVSTFGRGRIREAMGAAAGALVGSAVPLLGLRAVSLPADTIGWMWGSIAGCSALGFAIWVLVAWQRVIRSASRWPGSR